MISEALLYLDFETNLHNLRDRDAEIRRREHLTEEKSARKGDEDAPERPPERAPPA